MMEERSKEQTGNGNKKMASILEQYLSYQKAWSRNSSIFVRDK